MLCHVSGLSRHLLVSESVSKADLNCFDLSHYTKKESIATADYL